MIFKLSFIGALFCLFSFSFDQKKEIDLIVNIQDLRNNKGHILISLFKDGVGYPDKPEKAFKKERLTISDNKAQVVFNNLSAGSYAIAILHDENDDEKMNKTKLGLPKEGYGFSNNAIGVFGPPSYNKAKLVLGTTENSKQEIRIRY